MHFSRCVLDLGEAAPELRVFVEEDEGRNDLP